MNNKKRIIEQRMELNYNQQRNFKGIKYTYIMEYCTVITHIFQKDY